MSHVRYANETAVREEGYAQRLCGLKMADDETSLGTAFSAASDMEEPAAKRSKISPVTNHGFKVAKAETFSCVSGVTESWESGGNCTQPAEKEAKPVMAVEQAPTTALGGDNNGLGLLVSEPHKPVVKLDDSVKLGTTEESADLDDMTLWQIIINISEPPKRKKRKDINTLEDVVRLLHESKRILVLTGAGVSVSCGIPDFRSRDGIYARLAVDFPDLPDPQAMFDIEYFRRDPRPFFKFAKEIYPGQFQPSPCHKFISMMDKQGKLLRNYTQNIDTLEQVAGVQRIIQCHGSFATASCLVCKHKVDCEAIREDIFNQVVPHCPRCPDIPLAIMKPDIVFFGENLPEMFHRAMKQDKDEVDLLIVIGSSLKVRPVALIPNSIPHEVPQVLINREQLPHLNFDVELLGDCDVIVNELCHRLGGDFEQLCYNTVRLTETTEKPPRLPEQPPSEALAASSDAAQEEQKQPSTDSVTKPSEETERLNVTDTAGNNVTPPEPCPNAQCPSEETAEPSELAAEDAPKEEAPGVKSQTSNLEFRRQCWMSRINRSPISKRLETGQYLFQAPNHYIFHGAEVYSDSEDETSSSCGSDSDESECSADGVEEDSEPEEADTLAADEETCLRDTIQPTLANEATSSVAETDNTSEKTQSTTHL
ncbi:hypothetical protein FQN60_009197 [Etheostoma spectabile]|uniref:protein acetyllysine N-acetyltransferase n=1 Tax=Etheostoma spectabile TaxID=54343 RepID=A0A5J5CE20_9PERO|nr:hypothetical protein FQN60_009197 [Etheostoma spectabile]